MREQMQAQGHQEWWRELPEQLEAQVHTAMCGCDHFHLIDSDHVISLK